MGSDERRPPLWAVGVCPAATSAPWRRLGYKYTRVRGRSSRRKASDDSWGTYDWWPPTKTMEGVGEAPGEHELVRGRKLETPKLDQVQSSSGRVKQDLVFCPSTPALARVQIGGEGSASSRARQARDTRH